MNPNPYESPNQRKVNEISTGLPIDAANITEYTLDRYQYGREKLRFIRIILILVIPLALVQFVLWKASLGHLFDVLLAPMLLTFGYFHTLRNTKPPVIVLGAEGIEYKGELNRFISWSDINRDRSKFGSRKWKLYYKSTPYKDPIILFIRCYSQDFRAIIQSKIGNA
jgi:hypothetical protein